MDKLRCMQVFVKVVEQGSFSAAARHFDISAVMAGKHIADLEQHLGARLLLRSTRRQQLSEIGAVYYQECCEILARVLAAEQRTEQMQLQPRGHLKIASAMAFGSECLAPAVAEFLKIYPEITLDLDLSDRYVDILAERYDAAIRVGQLSDSNLIARPLQAYDMVICAAPAYLEQHGKPTSLEQLAQHCCLDFLHWKPGTRWGLAQAQQRALVPAPRLRINHGHALKNAALAGLGIIMQARVLLQTELDQGRLVQLFPDLEIPDRTVHLLYPQNQLITPKLRCFIDFILQGFA